MKRILIDRTRRTVNERYLTAAMVVLIMLVSISAHAWQWPDTGQTKCYNDTVEIVCPAPGQPFYGQDAQYQGPTRSYTKLGQNGVALSDSATQAGGWVVTRDNVTGLVWELKTDDNSIHDKDKTFTWCDKNSATNGGNQGTCGSGTGSASTDTEAFINALNDAHFGGFSDWRMPTIKDLSSLVNSAIPYPGPTIDAAWFPNTVSSYYWSSTTNAGYTDYAWCVYFSDGSILDGGNRSYSYYVRAVRGGSDMSALVDNGDGTVTDTNTGLMWQKATAPGTYTWKQALAYAETLDVAGHTDWRLPNRNELQSLVDYSRYNPSIDPLLAPNTVSSYYWSSTTYANFTSSAWYVNFVFGPIYYFNKSNSYYVRAVRAGQSGLLGPLDHFDFSAISSPQAVGVPFNVTIMAKDANGNTLTEWNGSISLWSSAGSKSVYPGTIQIVNGQWTGSVTVNSAGSDIYLIAGNTYSSRTSNAFNVSGPGSLYGNLSGKITDRKGDPVFGSVTIVLEGSQNYSVTTLQSKYQFPLNQITCGNYTAHAEYGIIRSPSYTVNVPCSGQSVTQNFILPFSPTTCNTAGKTPVLLVAGIMGSATEEEGVGWIYPVLPKTAPEWDSEKLYLHDPYKQVGWKKLIKKLIEDEGYEKACTLFEVPYDWRMDSRDIAGKYLKPWIDEAVKNSPTGKVAIIAHSMGGLVTRAYIQGEARDEEGAKMPYGDDIERFAMVGTPNAGSSKAYYLWEGGDPLLLDNIVADGFWLGNIYWNITEENYDEAFSDSLWSWQHEKIWEYYTGGKPKGNEKNNAMFGLKNLLPTYPFLRKNSGKDNATPLTKVTNDFLTDLNSRSERYKMGDGSNGTIKTAVFVGKKDVKNTINHIKVRKSTGTTRYMDGQMEDEDDNDDRNVRDYYDYGDGTVLEHSAALPATEGWAMPAVAQAGCDDHSKLIKQFTENGNYLVKFLKDEPLTATATQQTSVMAPANDVPIDKALGISTKGRVQAYLVNPSGLGLGINITTGLSEENISDSSFRFQPDRGGLAIQEPVDGTYTLYIQGFYEENFDMAIAYMDSLTSKVIKLKGFNHANTISFSFTIDSVSADKITVNHTPSPPIGLQADAVDTGGLKTRLTWTASTDLNVTGYNIYSKYNDEPYFTQIGTASGNTFDTGHQWAENASVRTRIYAVSAVKGGGIESFFSNMVENNDRDHDGLADEREATLGTNPVVGDTDGDGLTDGEEPLRGTDPMLKDTDGDGYWDQAEILAGSDPLDPQSFSVDLYANFTGSGIWKWDGSAWSQVTASDPNMMVVSGSILYGAFGSGGIWKWDSSAWSQVTVSVPQDIVVSGSILYGDFGSGGIWKWGGATWSQVTASDPDMMVVSGSILYGAFGSGGIWKWDGATWSQVTASDPDMMAVTGSILYGVFGSGGIWKWDGSVWSQVTMSVPQNIAVSGPILYGDFGTGGIWKWDGSAWSQVTASDPNMMVVSGSILYGAFGAGGIWKWDGAAWSQVTASVPQDIVVSGSVLYGDFGSGGIWKWDSAAWSQVTASVPNMMVVSGSILYGAFGTGGIWKWDGSAWSQVTASVPDMMAVSGSILYGVFGSGGIWKWDGSAWSQVTASDPASMVTGS